MTEHPSPETLRKHAALFDDMGKRLGLDLEEETRTGQLHFDEVAEAVLRCTRCAEAEACTGWQKAHAKGAAEATPNYCRNQDLFRFLKDEEGQT